MENNKYVCSNCGSDLREVGIQVTTDTRAIYDEKSDKFVVESGCTQFECNNCAYPYTELQNVKLK